jgi:predicted ATP-grasp superfamily ATP-dependent carboligase
MITPGRARSVDTEVAAVVYPDNLGALGVCRALGVHGVPVTVVATHGSTPGQYSRYAHRVLRSSGARAPSMVAFLSELGREFSRPPVLFLTSDAALMAISPHQGVLERWFRFPSAPWPVLRQLMLKDRLYEGLAGVVPVPRTLVPSDEDELAAAGKTIRYPAVVKPLLRCLTDSPRPGGMPFERCFGAKAVRVTTWTELRDAYVSARASGFPVLVQEEIEGPSSALYSLGIYMTRAGQAAASFTAQKLAQVPADFGDALIVRAARAPELAALGARALAHFGYHGIADIEFKWDPRAGVFKLLDVNPRPWPWIHLPTACGVNLPYAAYLDALDRPVAGDHFVQRDFDIRWLSTSGLLTFTARSLRAGRPHRLLRVLRHAGRARVGGLVGFGDPLVRMFASPTYWSDCLRRAKAWFREVPGETAPLPNLETSGAGSAHGQITSIRRNSDG